jgi:hypothetical protein
VFEMGHTFLELYVAQVDAERRRAIWRDAGVGRLLRERRAPPVQPHAIFARRLAVGVGQRLVAWGARLQAQYGDWDVAPAIACEPELDCAPGMM